jgi:hypothetical protein
MGRYITTTGTSSTVLRTVSGAFNAAANDRVVCTAGGFTVTLPPVSEVLNNDTIQFLDATGVFGSSPVTIARNGAKIQNLAEDLTLNINNTALTLVYTGSTFGWLIVR